MYSQTNDSGAVDRTAPRRATWYILVGVLLYNVLADLRTSGLLLDSWPRWQVEAAELIVAFVTVATLGLLASIPLRRPRRSGAFRREAETLALLGCSPLR
jgi:hypothetical protein